MAAGHAMDLSASLGCEEGPIVVPKNWLRTGGLVRKAAALVCAQLALLAPGWTQAAIRRVQDGGDGAPPRWAVTSAGLEARLELSSGCLSGLRSQRGWVLDGGTAEIGKPSFWSGGVVTPRVGKMRLPEAIVRPLASGSGQQLGFYGHLIQRGVQVGPQRKGFLYVFRIPNRGRELAEFEFALEHRLPKGWQVARVIDGAPELVTRGGKAPTGRYRAKLMPQASAESREAFDKALGVDSIGALAAYSPAARTALVFRSDPDAAFGCDVTWKEECPTLRLVCRGTRLRPGEVFTFPMQVDVRSRVSRTDVRGILSKRVAASALAPAAVAPVEEEVLYEETELEEIVALLKANDCDVLCEDASYALQSLALDLGRRFGLSVSCQRYTYGNQEHVAWAMACREKPVVVVGPPDVNPAATLVDSMAFTCSREYPGRGRGVIKLFRGLAMSSHPVVVISGSDREGARKAAELLMARGRSYRPPDFGDFFIYAEDPMLWTHTYSRTKQAEKLREMSILAARGERAIGRLALRTERGLSDLKITTSAPTLEATAAALPQPSIRELRPPSELDDKACLLDPRIRARVPPRLTRGYWLEFPVPRSAPPGRYRGEIRVSTSNAGEHTLAVAVEVWDFALPERSPIAVTMWNLFPKEDPEAQRLVPDPEKLIGDPVFQTVLSSLRRHEINVDSSSTPMQYCRWVENSEGEIEFDYSAFDRYMEFMDKNGFDRGVRLYYVWHGRAGKVDPDRFVCLKYSPGWEAYFDKDGQEQKFGSKLEWAKVAQRYNRDFVDHLKARGWHDRAFITISDEPGDYPRWRREVLPFHRLGIGFTVAMGHSCFRGEQYVDDVHQRWIVHQWSAKGVGPNPFVKRRLAQGDRMWWYECAGHHLENLDLAPMRSFGIDAWREHVQGFGRYWYGGPFSYQSAEPRIRDGIGWELFRKGIEDYKFLWVLDSRIRMAEALGDTDVTRQAREEMNDLLEPLPHTYALINRSVRLDFLRVKRRLADGILSLDKYAWNPEFYPWRQGGTLNWYEAVKRAKEHAAGTALAHKLHELALERHAKDLADRAAALASVARALPGAEGDLRYVIDYLAKLAVDAAAIRLTGAGDGASEPMKQRKWKQFALRVVNGGNAPLTSVSLALPPGKGVAFEPGGELAVGNVPRKGEKSVPVKVRLSEHFRERRFVLEPVLHYERGGHRNACAVAALSVPVQLEVAVERACLAGRSFRPRSLAERRAVNNVFPTQFSFRLRSNLARETSVRLRLVTPAAWLCEPGERTVVLGPGATGETQFALKLGHNAHPPRGEDRVGLRIAYGDVQTVQDFRLPFERLQEWSVIGPFQVMPGLSTDFISYPKKPVDLRRSHARPSGRPAKWQRVPMEGELDFAYFFGNYADEGLGPLVGPNFAVAFAHAYFHSPRAQRARIEVGSANKCSIWVNRRMVLSQEDEEGAGAGGLLGGEDEELGGDEDDLDLEEEDDDEGVLIRSGWNEVCIKCFKETEQQWKARLLFKPVDAGDKAFRPPVTFLSRPP